MNPTLDDIEAMRRDDLARRRLPGDGPTWLAVAAQAARDVGADLGAVIGSSRKRAAVSARRQAWVTLADAGLSTVEIGAGWPADPSTVSDGIRAARAAGAAYPVELEDLGPLEEGGTA